MRQVLADVYSGAGAVVLITGEAGVGKSRLLAESREIAEAGSREAGPSLLWLEGRCASYGEAVPYFPFSRLLRDWLDVGESDSPLRVRVALRRRVEELFDEAADDLYPRLASLLGAAEDATTLQLAELDAEQLQRSTFAAVGNLSERLASTRPVVAAIEDLQWADATSIQLTRSLLPVVERVALLLLLVQRDERDHPAWGLREAAIRDFPHLVHELGLEPLPPAAERDLLRELLGSETLDENLERRVVEVADGNPLYLEELVRSLVDAGEGGRGERRGRLAPGAPVALPETIEKVILARTDRLLPRSHAVLRAAAVIGREFEPQLLADLAGSEPPLEKALHELQRLGFVLAGRRWAGPLYRFKHVLIQEAVYGTMLTDERARLHQAAAESLERRAGETQEDVLALARHWAAAGVSKPAIAHYRRAGELALRAYANEEAVEALLAALDLLAGEPEGAERDEQELELRTMLGVPLVALRGYGASFIGEQYSRARDLCVRLARPVSGPILRGLAIHAVSRLELDDASQHSAALLVAAERENDPILIVEGHYARGVTSFWLGDFPDACRHLEEAIVSSSPERSEAHISLYSQDPRVICLSRLAWTRWLLGYAEQAIRTRDAAVSLAAEVAHPFSSCYANVYAAIVSNELGDEALGARLASVVEEQAADERYRLWQIIGSALGSWPAARRGDLDALAALRAALGSFGEIGQPLFDTYVLSLVGRSCLQAGDTAAGLEAVERALELTERTSGHYLDAELHRIRGQLLEAAGKAATDVEEAFLVALEVAQGQHAKALELRVATDLGRRQIEQGGASERAEALELLKRIYGWFTEGHETPDLQAARSLLAAAS